MRMLRRGSVLFFLYSIQTSLMSRLTAVLGTEEEAFCWIPDPWGFRAVLICVDPELRFPVVEAIRRQTLAKRRLPLPFIGHWPVRPAIFFPFFSVRPSSFPRACRLSWLQRRVR